MDNETHAARLLAVASALGVNLPDVLTSKQHRADRRTLRPLNSDDYVNDWHGSVRRNFKKATPKKLRSKMRRAKKLAALAETAKPVDDGRCITFLFGYALRKAVRKSWHPKPETATV